MFKPILSIYIPVYNHEKYIRKSLDSVIMQRTQYPFEVLIGDDCSTDRTRKILEENNIPHISLIQNLGIGGAVQTGYKYAYEHNYDVAVQYDGDGQHNIEYVKNIIEPIKNNEANMVIGSRFVKDIDTFKSSFERRIGIKVISIFMKFATGKKIYDTTSGMRAVDRDLIYDFSISYSAENSFVLTGVATILFRNLRYYHPPMQVVNAAGQISEL